MAFTIQSLKEKIPGSEIVGKADAVVTSCSSAADSIKDSLCFAAEEEQFQMALKGEAKVVVVPLKLMEKVEIPEGITALFVKNHSLAHAQLAEIIHGRYPDIEKKAFTHPSSIVAPSAVLGKNVRIGPNAIIGERVKIGDDVVIGANCVIETNAKIGSRTHLWPMVYVGRGCVVREDCHIHPNTTIGSEGFGFAHDAKGNHFRIPQLGNVVVQSRVEIGANVAIDRATFGSTVIGEGSKLDNLIHVAHNVVIGRNCLLTAGFKIAGSAKIGDNVVTGGHVLVTDHVEVCSDVQLAGWSGVNNDIKAPGAYGGHPLQPLRDYMKTTMCLPHLPNFRKALRQLEQRVLGKKSSEDKETDL